MVTNEDDLFAQVLKLVNKSTANKMASLEEVIASRDPKLIKRKRGPVQGIITYIQKNLGRLLARSVGKFDHGKIQILQV